VSGDSGDSQHPESRRQEYQTQNGSLDTRLQPEQSHESKRSPLSAAPHLRGAVQKKEPMRRGLLLLSTVLICPALAPAASAKKPTKQINPSQDDVLITDQCAFPVLGHIEGIEIIKTWIDDAGNPVKQIATFPGNTLTFTNLDTGTSVTVAGTGSSQLRAERDGSVSARAMGHGPFFPNPITGEPGIWYLSGQGKATIDSQGNVTSAKLAGKLVDLCPSLAS
jgi:hypothetical protein